MTNDSTLPPGLEATDRPQKREIAVLIIEAGGWQVTVATDGGPGFLVAAELVPDILQLTPRDRYPSVLEALTAIRIDIAAHERLRAEQPLTDPVARIADGVARELFGLMPGPVPMHRRVAGEYPVVSDADLLKGGRR